MAQLLRSTNHRLQRRLSALVLLLRLLQRLRLLWLVPMKLTPCAMQFAAQLLLLLLLLLLLPLQQLLLLLLLPLPLQLLLMQLCSPHRLILNGA